MTRYRYRTHEIEAHQLTRELLESILFNGAPYPEGLGISNATYNSTSRTIRHAVLIVDTGNECRKIHEGDYWYYDCNGNRRALDRLSFEAAYELVPKRTAQEPLDLKQFEGHTPEPWRDGICGGIVADGDTGHDSPDNVDFYGGHLICESVTPRNRVLLREAPRLLRELATVTAQRDRMFVILAAQAHGHQENSNFPPCICSICKLVAEINQTKSPADDRSAGACESETNL